MAAHHPRRCEHPCSPCLRLEAEQERLLSATARLRSTLAQRDHRIEHLEQLLKITTDMLYRTNSREKLAIAQWNKESKWTDGAPSIEDHDCENNDAARHEKKDTATTSQEALGIDSTQSQAYPTPSSELSTHVSAGESVVRLRFCATTHMEAALICASEKAVAGAALTFVRISTKTAGLQWPEIRNYKDWCEAELMKYDDGLRSRIEHHQRREEACHLSTEQARAHIIEEGTKIAEEALGLDLQDTLWDEKEKHLRIRLDQLKRDDDELKRRRDQECTLQPDTLQVRNQRQRAREQEERKTELERGHCIRVLVTIKPGQAQASALIVNRNRDELYIKDKKKDGLYKVDRVFKEGFKISDVHDYLIDTISMDQLSNGRTLVVLAYGRTGTGKTRLLTRGDKGVESSLVYTIASWFVHQAHDKLDAGSRMKVKAIEVYSNKAYDFLSRLSTGQLGPELGLFDRERGEFYSKEKTGERLYATELDVTSVSTLGKLVADVNALRSTTPTTHNKGGSSRSHLVLAFTIYLYIKTARVIFVDLAGDEDRDTVEDPETASPQKQEKVAEREDCLKQERKDIRQDLESLRTNVCNLSKQEARSPYRTLTKVLRPFFDCADVNYIGTVAADGTARVLKDTLSDLEMARTVQTGKVGSKSSRAGGQ